MEGRNLVKPPVEGTVVFFPIIYGGFSTIPGGCLGFLKHQQYCVFLQWSFVNTSHLLWGEYLNTFFVCNHLSSNSKKVDNGRCYLVVSKWFPIFISKKKNIYICYIQYYQIWFHPLNCLQKLCWNWKSPQVWSRIKMSTICIYIYIYIVFVNVE